MNHDHTTYIYNTILRIKSKNRKLKDHKSVMTDTTFKKEFCTLKISFPRRFGNTTLALELLRLFPKAVLLTPTSQSTNNAKSKAPNLSNRIFQIKNYSASKIFQTNLSDITIKNPSVVILDTTTSFEQHTINAIYTLNSNMFVFIQ